MSTPRLDEQALRRTPFSEGYGVELADGQAWVIPALKVMGAFLHDRDDGTTATVWRPAYADEHAGDLDALFGISGDGQDMIEAEMRLAARLLKQNYDLPRGSVGRLMPRVFGDAASEAMWRKIVHVILGRDPAAIDADDSKGDDGDPKGPTPPG